MYHLSCRSATSPREDSLPESELSESLMKLLHDQTWDLTMDVRLSRQQLDLLDLGINHLRAVVREEVDEERTFRQSDRVLRSQPRLELTGVENAVQDEIVVDIGEAANTAWVEAGLAVAAATWAVYKAYKSGVELQDRIFDLRDVEARLGVSIEELIQTRNQLEQQLFENGL